MTGAEKSAVNFALAMCRDAYGNAISGQEARSAGFTAATIKVLEALQAHGEAKGDVRAEAALKATLQEAIVDTEALPAFDSSIAATSMEQAQEKGLWKEGVLQRVDA